MTKLVYLAGGMEFAGDASSWRSTATELLRAHGFSSWDPYIMEQNIFGTESLAHLKTLSKEKSLPEFIEHMSAIIDTDLGVIEKEADIVLVRCDRVALAGAGTHAEISFAHYIGKPVHFWMDMPIKDVPSWFLGCITTISSSLEEAVNNLVRYDSVTS